MKIMIIGVSGGIGKALLANAVHDYDVETIFGVRRSKDPDMQASEKLIIGDLKASTVRARIVETASHNPLDVVYFSVGVYNTNLAEQLGLANATIDLFTALSNIPTPPERIVHVNSIAAKGYHPNEAAYASGKALIAAFIKNSRKEFLAKGMQIMDVFIGATNTKMTDGRPDQEKFMDPKEVAYAIYWQAKHFKTLQVEELTLGRIL